MHATTSVRRLVKTATVLVGIALLAAGDSSADEIAIGRIPEGPAFNVFAPPQGSSVEVCHQVPRASFGPSGSFTLRGEVALSAIGPFGSSGDVSFRLRAGGAAGSDAHTADIHPLQVQLEVRIVEVSEENLRAFPLSTVFAFESEQTTTLPDGDGDVQFCIRSDREGAGVPVWNEPGITALGRDADVGRLIEFLDNRIGLRLLVSPKVTASDNVEAVIVPQVANLVLPNVEWRTTTTVLAVEDGATVMVEGIERDTGRKTTVLGELPLIGGLFRSVDTLQGAGSLIFTITPVLLQDSGARTASIAVTANTAVQSTITATLPDGRQFGQLLNGRPLADAQPAGTAAILFTSHDPSRYRINVGVTAAEDDTVVRLTPLDAEGTALAAAHDLNLPVVGANTQINDVFAFFGLADTPDAAIEVEVISGSAFSYSSAVDGRSPSLGTSDPTTQLPARQGAERVTLLEVGRIQGINEFSGSAMVHNHSSITAFVQARFTPRGQTFPAATVSLTLAPHQTLGWDDVVGELLGRSGEIGTLTLTTTNGAKISALAREFAIFRDSHNQIVGTAGQLMPGLTDADLLQPGRTYHYLGLVEDGGERSHFAAYNPGPGSVTLSIASFAADGTARGNLQRSIRSGELLRVNSILLALDGGHDGGERRLELTVSGPVHVLAYRVNATGDPVTLQPFWG